MTDYSSENICALQNQPQLLPFIKAGVLDFAIYRAGIDDKISLINSKKEYNSKVQIKNSVVIANYIFDSLPLDMYKIKNGELEEGLVALHLKGEKPHKMQAKGYFERIKLDWTFRKAKDNPYQDPVLNELLKKYVEICGNLKFSLPLHAIKTIKNLKSLTSESMLMIAGDKAYNGIDEIANHKAESMTCHGSFSFNVNFHMLGLFVEKYGGTSMHTSPRSTSVSFAGFIFGKKDQHFPETKHCFQDKFEDFNPAEFHKLDLSSANLNGSLAIIHLSSYNPDTFYKLSKTLELQTDSISDKEKFYVCCTLEKVFRNFYHLDNKDIPFAIGRVYQIMGFYELAFSYFKKSLSIFGKSQSIYFQLGMCCFKQNFLKKSLGFFVTCLEINPKDGDAKNMKIETERKLKILGYVKVKKNVA